MRSFRTVPILGAAALTAACMPAEPVELTAPERMRLDAALEGRIAGEPQDCVNLRDLRGNRSVGEGVFLFDGPGGLVYVNRPPGGCPSLDFGRALEVRTTSSRLCRGEVVGVFDPVSGVHMGGCGLGEFVPWRRAR
jgi:hypothetical protein